MDPSSWPNGEMSELERRLLEAARQDRIPDALGARMAEGLGLHATSAAVQAGLAGGGKLAAPLFAKAGLWGVLSLALAGGAATWYLTRPAPAAQQHAVAQPAGARVAQVAARDPGGPVSAQSEEVSAAPSLPSATGIVPGAPARADSSPEAPAFDDAALRAEIALLDRARAALRRGSSARALRLLDQHGARFAEPRLAPEAAALRIEALVQRGARAQAQALSEEFVSAYPAHPLSDRIEQLFTPSSGAGRLQKSQVKPAR